MEIIKNLKPIFAAILLIGAGLISPSNGFDDRTYKTPFEMITIIFVIIILSATLYLIWNSLSRNRKTNQNNITSTRIF